MENIHNTLYTCVHFSRKKKKKLNDKNRGAQVLNEEIPIHTVKYFLVPERGGLNFWGYGFYHVRAALVLSPHRAYRIHYCKVLLYMSYDDGNMHIICTIHLYGRVVFDVLNSREML